jgi:glycosyltransferase involved in cell wall biosynthesis
VNKQESHTSEPNQDESGKVYKIAIIAPTCRYYQVPLFQTLASDPQIDLTVYFCSDEAITSKDVSRMFKTGGTWGIEDTLLNGYNYKFLKNYSPFPSYLTPAYGLMNFGIWPELRKNKPDAIILMAWVNPVWFIAMAASFTIKSSFFFLTDANIEAEVLKRGWKILLKKFTLGKIIFPLAGGFLCSGSANSRLYSYYGVPDKKLVPFAYSWGSNRLPLESPTPLGNKAKIREDLGIPQDTRVLLFCGRLHPEKNPFHLLEAYDKISSPTTMLAFVGDGDLRQPMEQYVTDHHLDSVRFFGFQDRNDIAKYYKASDALVLPSFRESWGIVVNEGMAFGLPIIVSNQVGAGNDLVEHGVNGYIFNEGDKDELSNQLELICAMPQDELDKMGQRSLELIGEWSSRNLGATLVNYLDNSNTKDSSNGAAPNTRPGI